MELRCRLYLCFAVVLLGLTSTEGTDNDTQHPSSGSTAPQHWQQGNILDLLTGRVYNPLGFIMEGNNQQYSAGNGGDTQGYDPNLYSYMYAGANVGQSGAPHHMPYPGGSFIPSHGGTGTLHGSTTGANRSANKTDVTANGTVSESSAVSQTAHFTAQNAQISGLLEAYMKMLNGTHACSRPSYNGVPGMLGANFGGFTGMSSEGGQHTGAFNNNPEAFAAMMSLVASQQATGGKDSAIAAQNPPNPMYSGTPGMLGSGGKMQMLDPFLSGGAESAYLAESQSTEHGGSDHEMEHDSRGHSNMDYYQFGQTGNSGVVSSVGAPDSNGGEFGNSDTAGGILGTGDVGGTGGNENNWNGEWKSRSDSSDKDWTGAWSDNWPNNAYVAVTG